MTAYFDESDCKIEDFARLTSRTLDTAGLRFAVAVERNIPIYDAPSLDAVLADAEQRRALMAEWAGVLGDQSGVLVIRQAVPDHEALDRATGIFSDIIAEERKRGTGGDHFAKAGANDRLWNSLQKLCLADPAIFARCFASPAIDAVCEAWLGWGYQMTAQVNLVRPGGRAQTAHRDYHLGFMTQTQAEAIPAAMHVLSPRLTLQGAVAHCDMPVVSGPTKLLPFSQSYAPGYVAYHLPEFRDYFEEHYVQLPLTKGDALFFSPALFHGAGDNNSNDIARLANLLQISSPMGRAMESVDRAAMAKALYPVLLQLNLGALDRKAVISAAAEGYSFPTNLDRDPPKNGMAPETPAALMTRMLRDGVVTEKFSAALDAAMVRREV